VRSSALACVLLATLVSGAAAADFSILGGRLAVKDPSGSEDRRSVVATAKEQASDVPALANPMAGGAMLTIVLDGGTGSSQTFVLDAGGWSATGTSGYRYAGPTGADGDPVKKVVLQRRASGTALLKLALRGSVGTQALTLVPPNLGVDAAIALDVAGDRYCAAFGGTAGGTVRRDTSQVWKVVSPGAEAGCPTTTSTTMVAPVCGDGVVQLPEECEPTAPLACVQIPEVACGAADGPVACRCCIVPGGALEFLLDQPVCCDGSPCNLPTPFICECPS
jgi:hypothetical protein